MKKPNILFIVLLSISLCSCATYYQKLAEFNASIETGNIDKAKSILEKEKKAEQGKNRLLYFMNRGTVEMLAGNYELSNQYFNKADLTIEDYQNNPAMQALSFVSNQMTMEYRAEDFEKVLIHYYKALNYLSLNDYEAALVECRRLNLKILQLNEKYTRKNRYSEDAFGLNLMGIIYEASGDVNNAFIAYRNAAEAYEKIYEAQFQTAVPLQLKKDLIRTAYENGFYDDVDRYEEKYKLKLEKRPKGKGELVFFWNNGLGPVKAENSITFNIIKGDVGFVNFTNDELGISIPFPLPKDESTGSALGDIEFVRVAFPKYVERKPYYTSASLVIDSSASYPLESAENVNNIAFKTLQDRMLREMGTSLMRLATKKAAEYAVRDQNQDLGSVVGMVNAFTEKADTRNWQTLPYAIEYARVPMDTGRHDVRFVMNAYDNKSIKDQKFNFVIKEAESTFQFFQNFECQPNSMPTNYARP